MKDNLFSAISAGELIAIGVFVAATKYAGPEIIPSELFELGSREMLEAALWETPHHCNSPDVNG